MRPATETPSRSASSEQYAGACPRCGAPFAEDQEYCLECGLRLPVRGPSFGPERRRRWYPGSWFWPAVAFLLLAAAGAAAAILLSDRSKAAETLVATAPPGRTRAVLVPTGAPPATTAATLPSPPLGTPSTAPTTTAAAPPPPPKQTKPIGWPAGQRGYTVVLASIPATRGRDAAVEQARRAIAAGLRGVGILNSSSFSSLHPGYFVIFTGARDSEAATARDLSAAQTGGYPRAYARQITP